MKKGTMTIKELNDFIRAMEFICKGKHIPCNVMSGVCERCGMMGIKFTRPLKGKKEKHGNKTI